MFLVYLIHIWCKMFKISYY